MANVITGRVWTLDTASITDNIVDGPVYISRIDFYPDATDNDLVMQDGYGGVLFTVRAIATASSNESSGIETWINFAPSIPIHGLRLHTLDAGRVEVTIL